MKYIAVIPFLLLCACALKPEVKKDQAGNEISEHFVEVSGTAGPTDVARFLAGRPVRQGNQLSRLQLTGEYRSYSHEMMKRWKLRTARRVQAQIAWQQEHINPLIGAPRTLVYPFGGPDLLYAMSVFPRASQYILLGLEPVGNMPDLENTQPLSVVSSLPRHSKSIESQMLYGYFITKDMKVDLSNGAFQGVTPILLTSLGLMDATISNVQSINAGGYPAIQIDFTLPGWGRKSAIYVSGDLSNYGFNGSFKSWLSSVGSGSVGYFKAASYLMQDSGFSATKNWVLGNCRAVVQDDSGIPYAAYNPQQWDIHLFGNYQAPIEFFTKNSQPNLKAAYDSAGPQPALTYGSGYQMKAANANLMIAVRR